MKKTKGEHPPPTASFYSSCTLTHSELTLHTPPQNIEDCCSMSALQCYRANLQVFNSQDRKMSKLIKSLNSHITVRGLDFCDSGAAEPNCTECHLHPKENANEFFNRLESFIQKAITRLTVD
ncbi:interleukin-21 isoform X2 [Scomber scombrus]|uniref:Interleukin n=1 Tax=Scomber scombrus TaxID=13677 RepID=A0AAV1P1C6_SCOSC